MSLFKIFKGKENNLSAVPCHEGYAYFTEDTGNLFIDVTSSEGGRVQVNAYAAQVLRKKVQDTGEIKEIDIDDLLLNNTVMAVNKGGTGKETLTINALLVGNGTDPIKMVALDAGSIAVGDSTNGVAGLKGKGILYDTTEGGSPQFGTAPVEVGGTGKNSITAGAILKGDGANAIAEITGTGVLYSATENNPQFGTAPVQIGGTGKTSITTGAILKGNGTDPVTEISGTGVLYSATENNPEFGTASVPVGGTGKTSFTAGTILKGNGTDALQEITGTGVLYAATANAPQFGTAPVGAGGTGKISFTSGAILKGNGTGAVAEISGTGVLFASANNSPQFGIAPLTAGGTGGNDPATARNNLSVYSKQEVDDEVTSATSTVYATTLFADGWLESEGVYTYNYTNSNLKCGSTGTIPPIITYTSNQEEYSQIESAVATQGTGIIFTTSTKPSADIAIVIIDIG